jgi:hypothetical protein
MVRKRSIRNTRFVISVGPHWQGKGPAPDDRFIGLDGLPTDSRLRAAKFFTHKDAADFAASKGISLDGAMRYIRPADFSDSELRSSN